MKLFRRKTRDFEYRPMIMQSMYIRENGDLYIQCEPHAPLGSKIKVIYHTVNIEGEICDFTKSGIVLTNWKIFK